MGWATILEPRSPNEFSGRRSFLLHPPNANCHSSQSRNLACSSIQKGSIGEITISSAKMGKQPVKLKAVVYALSPFQQKVMPGLWKDLPGKIHHKVSENWISATLLLAPLVGTYSYVQHFKEKEKLEHRY
ncbi:hypothetical protein HAX54_043790 [Datura stramonium]|nr:hypothetical protein [Datura stramonium]